MKTLTEKQRLYYSVVYNHDIFSTEWSDEQILSFNGLKDIEVNPLRLFHAALECGGVPINYIKKALKECAPMEELKILFVEKNRHFFDGILTFKQLFTFVEWVCENVHVIAQYEAVGEKKHVVLLHENDGIMLFIDGEKQIKNDDVLNDIICDNLIWSDDYVNFYTKKYKIRFRENTCLVGAEIVDDETGGWDTKGGEEMTYICGVRLFWGDSHKDIGNIQHVNLDDEYEMYHSDIQDSLIDCLIVIKENEKVVPLPKKIG